MFKVLLVIVVTGGASFYFTDLGGEAAFYAIVLPIVDALALMALAVWLVMFFQRQGINQYTGPGSGPGGVDGGGFGEGGGDGV